MVAIEAHELTKTFVQTKKEPGFGGTLRALFAPKRTSVEAVKGISLQIEQGERVGFLGPNGAGKTTTIKMLTGILYPTSGEAHVLGYVPFERKPDLLRRISLVMGNKMQLWWDLPAWDSFLVLKELYDVDSAHFKTRIEFLIEELQLTDKIHTQVRKLSLGERMKCELVAALLHSPEVLFLDEPTIGLDIVSQKRIRDFLRELNRTDKCTILLTSHYMQDVEELCERVVVIDHGSLIFDDSLEALASRFGSVRRLNLVFDRIVDESELKAFGKVLDCQPDSASLEVPKEQIATATAAILQAFPVSDVGIESVDIEEIVRGLFTESR